MLETIREFAAERLAELVDSDEVRRRHACRFLETAAATWERCLAGVSLHFEFERLSRDEENLRVALEEHRATGNDDALGRLCAALFFHWFFLGDPREGAHWARTALQGRVDEGLRAELENELAALVLLQGATDEARHLAEASVARARRIPDDRRLMLALTTLGNAFAAPGAKRDLRLARAAYEEALARCIAQGGGWYERGLWHNLGLLDLAARDFAEARRRFGVSHSQAVAAGDRHVLAGTSIGLAWVAAELGEGAEARSAGAAGLAEAHQLGIRIDVLSCLHLTAYLDALDGDATRGARLLGAVVARGTEAGLDVDQIDEHEIARTREALRVVLGDPACEIAAREGESLSLEDAVELALEALV
jgi:hypothetical protein